MTPSGTASDPSSDPRDGRDIRALLLDTEATCRVMRKAVREALLVHKKLGQSIVVWEDGRVVWVGPEEIELAGDD